MKAYPSALYRSTIRVMIMFAVLSISTSQAASHLSVQEPETLPELSLRLIQDGFNGTLKLNGKVYLIENKVTKEAFLTRVTKPDGSLLVESSKKDDMVSVSLPTGIVKVNSMNPTPFSSEETKAIRDFIKSEDALVVRRVISEVVKQRRSESHPLLEGFTIIAMLLGDA